MSLVLLGTVVLLAYAGCNPGTQKTAARKQPGEATPTPATPSTAESATAQPAATETVAPAMVPAANPVRSDSTPATVEPPKEDLSVAQDAPNSVERETANSVTPTTEVVQVTPPALAEVYVGPNGKDADDGSADRPFGSIRHALERAAPGATVHLGAGVYREGNLKPESGTKEKPFVLEGAGMDKTFIRGSREVKGWQDAGEGRWKAAWDVSSQQVFCDGKHLQQIGVGSPWHKKALWEGKMTLPPVGKGLADLVPGSFFVDGQSRQLYVMLPDKSSPTRHLMEASTEDCVLNGSGTSHVVVRKLAVQHCNGTEKGGYSTLAKTGTSDWLMEDCAIEYGDFAGVGVSGQRIVLRRCHVRNHGDVGINGWNGGPGAKAGYDEKAKRMDCLVEECLFEGNNYRNFDPAWHAGGMKWIPSCHAVTVRGCTVRDNNGPGIWFDHALGDILIEQNTVVGNRTGIFYEIAGPAEGDAYGIRVRNNLLLRNKTQAIYIAASRKAIVENNTCFDNWCNIVVHGMPRGSFRLQDNVVQNNILGAPKLANLILFVGKDSSGNTLEGNFFVTGRIMGWGEALKGIRAGLVTNNGYGTNCPELSKLQKSGYEKSGKEGDPGFANPAKDDFRLRPGSPATGKGRGD